MTDAGDASEAIADAARRLVPELAERLRRHGLGEIEVTRGELHLRVAGTPSASGAGDEARAERRETASSGPAVPRDTDPGTVPVSSPAVGFFVYADGLGPGLEVAKGDELGHVEMLGIRHDVRAPRAGTVRSLVAESGEAVEYGQVVVELGVAPAAETGAPA